MGVLMIKVFKKSLALLIVAILFVTLAISGMNWVIQFAESARP